MFLTGFPIWIEQPDHTTIRTYLCENIPEFVQIFTTSLLWIRAICERSHGLYDIYITFNHLADAFIQSDVQMRRTIEAIRPSREQQYTSAMTSLS